MEGTCCAYSFFLEEGRFVYYYTINCTMKFQGQMEGQCCAAAAWAVPPLHFNLTCLLCVQISDTRYTNNCCSVFLLCWCHFQLKPTSVVVSYLVFIKQHSTSSHDYVHAAVPVLTNRGLLCPTEEKVHFSVDYHNIDLPARLPGKEIICIHFQKAFCSIFRSLLLTVCSKLSGGHILSFLPFESRILTQMDKLYTNELFFNLKIVRKTIISYNSCSSSTGYPHKFILSAFKG